MRFNITVQERDFGSDQSKFSAAHVVGNAINRYMPDAGEVVVDVAEKFIGLKHVPLQKNVYFDLPEKVEVWIKARGAGLNPGPFTFTLGEEIELGKPTDGDDSENPEL